MFGVGLITRCGKVGDHARRDGSAANTYVPDASFLVGDGSPRPVTRKWLAGDVIGVMVDLGAGDIMFTLNGQFLDSGFVGVARGKAIVSCIVWLR